MTYNYSYPYITAWGKLLRSSQYYIEQEVEVATIQEAPKDAVYRNSNGEWVTFDMIINPDNRQRVSSMVNELKRMESFL